ncbi:MAG: hypothetical protein F4029_16990 [Gammaproteobacteria bacterium]|nr:hypothetical protein [Gammaproteobacteria bacterium]MYF29402.1 hypothetical protein [Gammaproteobacteria bacterium]MYK47914.1 hypothetical protein [Gammaproteobacteria bacterium]
MAVDAGGDKPRPYATVFLGPEPFQLLVIEALHFIERLLGTEGFEQLTQSREVMESQVRRQGSRVVGDFVARILCGKRQGPDAPGQGEFSEALDEHLQEALQIKVVECRALRPRQCREVFGECPA